MQDLPLSTPMFLGIEIALYIIFAIPLYVIGQKTGQDNPWFAFVPILNIILMLQIADKDLWWILLLLIPCVNVIIMVMVWMAIADAMEKPEWLGVLMLIPVVNIVIPFYLAFG